MSRKLLVLQELISATINQREWHGHQLPLGYTTTGLLHHWNCGGSGARTRIDELRKAGLQINYKCLNYIEKKTGLLADPEEQGLNVEDHQKAIDKLFVRLTNGWGEMDSCHTYCLATPVEHINQETGELKKDSNLFQQSTLEF